ncbi:RNA polymerase sigma factor [Sphingomonas xanthus]|uniref:Sigma-70 family RNA polymerase sigma factor n=1 Tax=Sphingomonas xanthus TaxID=2594473 RepID=A0A516IR63_9SPHN|nr:sigma-70 family RNA polymerase sigma factor [Sphingomonas xanthus]QDP19390.1 sigma-70 family RNA polymerase sigma factor [Sphingomonas xanthus]
MTPSSTFDQELAAIWPRLRRFAYSLARDPTDGDDLAQMAAEKAFKSFHQFQPGTRFDSWLFRICRTVWIDTVRSNRRRVSHEAPAELGEIIGFDPRPGAEAAIDLARAMDAMNRLPDEQREIVSLILIEGFGYREAAEILDQPIGTVSSRLARGRQALMTLLGEGE